MEADGSGRSMRTRHHDDHHIEVRGPRQLEKLTSEQSQKTTTTKSVTTGHGLGAHPLHGRDSLASSDRATVGDQEPRRWADEAITSSDVERRSGRSEQRYREERSGRRSQSHGTQQRSSTVEQRSTQSLSRRNRNVAAAEMAYRTAGLPVGGESTRVSKLSTTSSSGRAKRRGGLSGMEDAADIIVEDAMEKAMEAMYGQTRRRAAIKDVSTSAETESVDRQTGMTTNSGAKRRGSFGYDDSRALGQTVSEVTSRDDSKRKAVSYVRVDDGVDVQRPASADGRMTNGVDYSARRRAARRQPPLVQSRPRHHPVFPSPSAARFQRRTGTNLLAAQRASGYSSDVALTSHRNNRSRQFRDDGAADLATTVEIKDPRRAQISAARAQYSSDDSETRDAQDSSTPTSAHRVPTLTKGMVTKVLHGERTQPTATRSVNEFHRFDVQSPTSPIQFTASPPPSVSAPSPLGAHRHGQPSAVIPVGADRSTYRKSEVDDNFLLKRAPGYDRRVEVEWRRPRHGGSATIHVATADSEDRPPSSSYAAFSNEPIIVSHLDDDKPMRRVRSMVSLDEVARPAGTGARSLTPVYSSRPDISMTNRQVLNLYLFNRREADDAGTRRETLTRNMTFDEERRARTEAKQTQTADMRVSPPVHRESTRYITQQAPKTKTQHCSRLIQTDSVKSAPRRRKQTPSRVSEETIIVKPNIIETREAEMVGDVFSERRRAAPSEPLSPTTVTSTRSLLSHSRADNFDEPPEEEILETTVVEEKEQRIEMTIREDLEFSLQRSRGTASAAAAAGEGRVEPWWIPDKFEAFVERKRQKITQTKDIDNRDDHTMRIDVEGGRDDISGGNDENETLNYESVPDRRRTRRSERETDNNVRVPIFLQDRYRSPQHEMTSPSSSLVRAKMTTHSEPKLNRRHQHYLTKRDQYYGSLFKDSPSRQGDARPSWTSKHQRHPASPSAELPRLRLRVVDDDDDEVSADSEAQDHRSSDKRYASSYPHHLSSPPLSSAESVASTLDNDDLGDRSVPEKRRSTSSRQATVIYPSYGDQGTVGSQTGEPNDQQFSDSLNQFDRVLTEIEEELLPPPPSFLLASANRKAQSKTGDTRDLHSQRSFTSPIAVPPVDVSRTRTKKPGPPTLEKSWKRSVTRPSTKSQKFYSTEMGHGEMMSISADRPHNYQSTQAASGRDVGGTADSSDFRHELGDRSYISLSLTEPVHPIPDERRKTKVVRQGQQLPESCAFAYGWTANQDHGHRQTKKPGRYEFRHSRPMQEDFETTAL